MVSMVSEFCSSIEILVIVLFLFFIASKKSFNKNLKSLFVSYFIFHISVYIAMTFD